MKSLHLRTCLAALAVVLAGCGIAASTTTGPKAKADKRRLPKAEFLGSYTWPVADHQQGGFSGLELSENGEQFALISDRGLLFSGQIIRHNGKVTKIDADAPEPLHDVTGKPLKAHTTDAEGLAVHPDGRLIVSFEGDHRIRSYPTAQKALRISSPAALGDLQGNSGVEALAIDAQARIYAIPERSGKLNLPFPV